MTSYTIHDVQVGDIITLAKGDTRITGRVRQCAVTSAEIEIGDTGYYGIGGEHDFTIESVNRCGFPLTLKPEPTPALEGVNDGEYIVVAEPGPAGDIIAGRVLANAPIDGKDWVEFGHLCRDYATPDTRLRVRKITRQQIEALLDPPELEYRTWTVGELDALPVGSVLLDGWGDHQMKITDALSWIDSSDGVQYTTEGTAAERLALVYRPDMPAVQGVPREISREQATAAVNSIANGLNWGGSTSIQELYSDVVATILRAVGHTIEGDLQ